MHACGHDAHMAILMATAELLAGMRDELPGTVLFVFQPAEEGPPPGEDGGATMFRDLGKTEGEPLKVRPKKGSALLFFPAAGGVPNAPFDVRTLHCGQAVSENAQHDKWISQLWLRQGRYTPTAPPDNSHANAANAIATYCTS